MHYNETDFIESLKSSSPLGLVTAKITITRRCNSRCRKCYFWRTKHQEEISYNNLIRIIDELAQFKCQKLNLIGGETTLFPKLVDVIEYANRKGFKCTVTTNGQIIDSDYTDNLKRTRINNVFVSLDSNIPAVHDYITGVKGAWEKTISSIRMLTKLIPKNIRNLGINHVLTSINYHLLGEFIKFISSEGIKSIKILPYEKIGYEKSDNELSLNDQCIDILNKQIIPKCVELSEQLKMETNITRIKNSLGNYSGGYFTKINKLQLKIPCFYPFYRINLDHRGNVYPCCSMKSKDYLMGNILETTLSDIIRGEKFVKFKKKLVPYTKYPECRTCWIAIDDNVQTVKQLGEIDINKLLLDSLNDQKKWCATGFREKCNIP